MYGLPKDFDASVFLGKTLEMISFNFNQIGLHFDGNIKITIEGSLIYRTTLNAEKIQTLTPPVSSTNLMGLLEHKVVAASAMSDGTLSLNFDNGHKIECLETPGDYESYQIAVAGRIIVV